MKPSGLECIEIGETVINGSIIERLEVDLRHVNYGLDDQQNYRNRARSSFSITDMAHVFHSLHGCNINPVKSSGYQYFVVEKDFFCDGRIFKIVFCIHESESNVAGIITFYRQR